MLFPVGIVGLAFFEHRDGIKAILLLEGCDRLRGGEPAVKQEIPGADACLLSHSDKIEYDVCRLLPGLFPPFVRQGTAVIVLCLTQQVFVIRCGEQTMVDRDE